MQTSLGFAILRGMEHRKRYSRAEQELVIESYRGSGRTLREFCEGEGLEIGRMERWIRAREKRDAEEVRFLEVEGSRLLVLRDGSEAIENAAKRHWPESVRQECLVHAHSNVREKVRLRDRADVDRLFKNLREAQGREAGEEAFDDLVEFVSERNAAAALALKNRRNALLAFHQLDVPSTLNITFLSTNLIENILRNWRAASGNVKRWNERKDMVSRWMAAGFLWAEAGFQKIRHAEDLPKLALALELSATDSAAIAASPSAPSSNATETSLAQCL